MNTSTKITLGLVSLAFSACGNSRAPQTPLDITNEHFILGGPTEAGYWKLDIKAGHGIYSSGSFDAPLNDAFTATQSGKAITLSNGNVSLQLTPGSCQDSRLGTGSLRVNLEMGEKVLTGCGSQSVLPDIRTISASGNEPFWNFRITGEQAVYTTPESLDGVLIPVTLSTKDEWKNYSGEINGVIFTLSITDAPCEDDMSGYAYPMTVRYKRGGSTFNGCARLD